jgi:hypothetical protein
MNSDFFSSKVFKNRDANNISTHNKSFFDNAGDSDEEEKNGVSRTSSFTSSTGVNANPFRKSVVNLGIDHKMLMNANSSLKTTKADSVGLAKLNIANIETIKEE